MIYSKWGSFGNKQKWGWEGVGFVMFADKSVIMHDTCSPAGDK